MAISIGAHYGALGHFLNTTEQAMAGKNILVADNETGVVELLETLLQRDGHRVFAAHNGREAVETVRKNPVDLAVLALTMPIMSGLEALRAIKEIDPNVEIVMMTAYTDLAPARRRR